MSERHAKRKKITFHSSEQLTKENRKHKKISFHSSSPAVKEESKEVNEISYLQPEILPLETMKQLLKLRGASEGFLSKECDTRTCIIKLFYKHITPKPQRDYKMNRFGKLLLKLRARREKRKEKNDWERMVSFETSKVSTTPSKSTSDNGSSCDRLKPVPSSCVNLDRRTIKISSSISSSDKTKFFEKDQEDRSLKKHKFDEVPVSVRKIKLSHSSSPVKGKTSVDKKTDLSSSSPATPATGGTVIDKKVIKLSPTSGSVKRESESSDSDTKKRQKISWP